MDKRKRLMNVQEASALLNRLSEEESDGGEVSGLSDVSWVCSASDGSSDRDPEPPRKVRPSHPDPPLEDAPTDVPAHAEAVTKEIGKDGTVWTVMEPCGGTGRRQIQNILTESAGPTPHACGNIPDKLTAFMCLCDSLMLKEIRDCTIAEARRENGDRATWDVLKNDKLVLSVYQCKPRRNVTILSTQHQHVAISTERKKKPETVEYYNHSKVGVDVLDQMARQYSVKEQSGKGRISCMVKTHCKQNKTSGKCIKCGDAVCGKCTAK
ncbi:hypothetical protein F7725_009409, partial [Dissostichus mawsoni]